MTSDISNCTQSIRCVVIVRLGSFDGKQKIIQNFAGELSWEGEIFKRMLEKLNQI